MPDSYCLPGPTSGTTPYQKRATAVIASPSSLVWPLMDNTRNITIAIVHRIHCVALLFIATSKSASPVKFSFVPPIAPSSETEEEQSEGDQRFHVSPCGSRIHPHSYAV